jgi:hypothetical protein
MSTMFCLTQKINSILHSHLILLYTIRDKFKPKDNNEFQQKTGLQVGF